MPEPPTLFDDYSKRIGAVKTQEMTIANHFFWGWDMFLHGEPTDKRFMGGLANEEYGRMTDAQKAEFDAAILFPNSLRSALEARALGIRNIIGYPGHHRRWLLKRTPPFTPESGGHHADRYLQLAAFCGAPVEPGGATFEGPRRKRSAAAPPRIGVCPGAEYGPAKRWPAERFAAAMREYHETTPAEWILFGVAGDAPTGEEIARACPFPVMNRIGQTTLDQLMDELAACDALLSNDTGTMHLAAFLGVPTVAIFGSTEPDLTSPLGAFHDILRHKVDCSPCFLRECPIDFRCMTNIPPSSAATALRKILNA